MKKIDIYQQKELEELTAFLVYIDKIESNRKNVKAFKMLFIQNPSVLLELFIDYESYQELSTHYAKLSNNDKVMKYNELKYETIEKLEMLISFMNIEKVTSYDLIDMYKKIEDKIKDKILDTFYF